MEHFFFRLPAKIAPPYTLIDALLLLIEKFVHLTNDGINLVRCWVTCLENT